MPTNEASWSSDQHAFLSQAIEYLSRDGQVVCVQLVMFAEALRDQPWTTATLRQVKRHGGVGNVYFDNCFAAKTAPAENLRHRKAAQAVLQTLLPDPGTQIKGHSRTQLELQQAAQYSDRVEDFASLLAILDTELRLITLVHQPRVNRSHEANEQRRYQLTHDFLVPALRTWLQREQLGTWRGRAQVRLQTRTALWHDRPESRQLPTLCEWVNMACLVRSSQRTPAETKMLRAAGRHHRRRLGCFLVAALLAVAAAGQWLMRDRAAHFHARLLEARTADVPELVTQLGFVRRWLDPRMLRSIEQDQLPRTEKLHLALALLATNAEQLGFLQSCLLDGSPDEVRAICEVLQAERQTLSEPGWRQLCHALQQVITDQDGPGSVRLRAACALAQLEPRRRHSVLLLARWWNRCWTSLLATSPVGCDCCGRSACR